MALTYSGVSCTFLALTDAADAAGTRMNKDAVNAIINLILKCDSISSEIISTPN
ncbi:MAG: hypothetical protein ACXVZU_05675 [Methanobacteriaceae archaeon]